jgi:transcriptional antiterminator RfaH
MAFWCCARLEHGREPLALRHLALNGFATYFPRLREIRRSHGRRIVATPALFPGYCFVEIALQWHAARWTIGVLQLLMDGSGPARVADSVIAEIRARERDGLIELPQRRLLPGARVQVVRGPLRGFDGLYAGMRPRERVLVLLAVLGASRRVELGADDVEAVQ